MKSFITRLHREAEELEEKVDKIFIFMDSDNFDILDDEDQKDIEEQSLVMSLYLDILRKRIEKHTNKTYYEH